MPKKEFSQNNKSLELTMKEVSRRVEQDREKILCFFSKLTQCETPGIPMKVKVQSVLPLLSFRI